MTGGSGHEADPGAEPAAEPEPAAARYAGARNVLIGVGAFYVSRWIAALLRTALTALVEGVMSAEGLRQALLTPFVVSLSHALAAAAAGAAVVLLVVDSAGPSRSPRASGAPGAPALPQAAGSPWAPRSLGSPGTSARWRWAAVPAVLWFVASLDEVTISAPGWVHLVTQLIAASLPSIVCLAAGHLADWHRSR